MHNVFDIHFFLGKIQSKGFSYATKYHKGYLQ